MAWIEGTEKQTFTVNAPLELVASFFAAPEQMRQCMTRLESAEEVEPGVWSWVLKEKSEKGLTFQGRYTVRYERDGDKVTWSTVRESNMRSSGTVSFKDRGQKTEVTYEETIATDLDIPKIAARVFRPIVAREIRKGVDTYLELVRSFLEEKHSAAGA